METAEYHWAVAAFKLAGITTDAPTGPRSTGSNVPRRSAVVTLDDVDLKNRLIRARAKRIDGVFWHPKTQCNRVVQISDALNCILHCYEQPCRSLWFFPCTTDKCLDPHNFSQDLRAINRQHGLNWFCLDFRHTLRFSMGKG